MFLACGQQLFPVFVVNPAHCQACWCIPPEKCSQTGVESWKLEGLFTASFLFRLEENPKKTKSVPCEAKPVLRCTPHIISVYLSSFFIRFKSRKCSHWALKKKGRGYCTVWDITRFLFFTLLSRNIFLAFLLNIFFVFM